MERAEIGKFVKIHYTVKLSDGKVVGRSTPDRPLGFTIGKGKVLKKLEQGVIGMRPGESRIIEIAPEEGYGQRNPDLVIKVPKEELPSQKDIAVGRTVQYMNESGGMVNFIILDVNAETVTMDANHPFAGTPLTYEVVLVSVEMPL